MLNKAGSYDLDLEYLFVLGNAILLMNIVLDNLPISHRGKFGKVYKAVERDGGDVFVAKYIKVTAKLRQDALDTVNVMKKLHHIRLANLVDVYDLDSQIVMIME